MAKPPDLVELTRRQIDAVNHRDMDTVMSLCSPDGVYDTSPGGLGLFEGPLAIRAFLQEWWDAFEDLHFGLEELLDVGNGVTFCVVRQNARPAGSPSYVQKREAYVVEWAGELVSRLTVYLDIDDARAAAKRLAEERA
jgi:ketosteroid isomerase-like protein